MSNTTPPRKKQRTAKTPRPETTRISLGTITWAFMLSLITIIVVALCLLYFFPLPPAPPEQSVEGISFVEAFLTTLENNAIPRNDIVVRAVTQNGEDDLQKRYHRFDISTPSTFDWPQGLEHLRKALATHQLVMNEMERSDERVRFLLTLDQRLLGEAVFAASRHGEPEKDASATVCDMVREQVRTAAIDNGISPGALSEEAVRYVATSETVITRYTALFSDLITVDMLHSAISEAINEVEVWSEVWALTGQRWLIQVYYQNMLCVELLCIPMPAMLTPLPHDIYLLDEVGVDWHDEEESRHTPLQGQIEPTSTDKAHGPLGREHPARVAIILDDGGYGGLDTERILDLDNRLTLAILPDTPFARYTAQTAAAKGFEIMLHMPMQSSLNGRHVFPGEITLAMTRAHIQQRTRECIAQFPEAVGTNNHTGTAFVADAEKIFWFMEVVKDHGLYFIDSRTTPHSRAYDMAVQLNVPSANRDVFLDNSPAPDEIRQQFAELVRIARLRGHAIGIGHFRPNTVTVLEEELPTLEAMDVVLVPVSEILL